jgi:hypothetical protein
MLGLAGHRRNAALAIGRALAVGPLRSKRHAAPAFAQAGIADKRCKKRAPRAQVFQRRQRAR